MTVAVVMVMKMDIYSDLYYSGGDGDDVCTL